MVFHRFALFFFSSITETSTNMKIGRYKDLKNVLSYVIVHSKTSHNSAKYLSS